MRLHLIAGHVALLTTNIAAVMGYPAGTFATTMRRRYVPGMEQDRVMRDLTLIRNTTDYITA